MIRLVVRESWLQHLDEEADQVAAHDVRCRFDTKSSCDLFTEIGKVPWRAQVRYHRELVDQQVLHDRVEDLHQVVDVVGPEADVVRPGDRDRMGNMVDEGRNVRFIAQEAPESIGADDAAGRDDGRDLIVRQVPWVIEQRSTRRVCGHDRLGRNIEDIGEPCIAEVTHVDCDSASLHLGNGSATADCESTSRGSLPSAISEHRPTIPGERGDSESESGETVDQPQVGAKRLGAFERQHKCDPTGLDDIGYLSAALGDSDVRPVQVCHPPRRFHDHHRAPKRIASDVLLFCVDREDLQNDVAVLELRKPEIPERVCMAAVTLMLDGKQQVVVGVRYTKSCRHVTPPVGRQPVGATANRDDLASSWFSLLLPILVSTAQSTAGNVSTLPIRRGSGPPYLSRPENALIVRLVGDRRCGYCHLVQQLPAISIVRCHAEGEVGDVIVAGVDPPPGETLWQQARWIAEDQSLRHFVLNEPRGGVFRHVNLLVPPKHPDADMGFIIMEPEHTPPMSGSNTICVATVLLETGILPMTEPETHLTLEAPGGLVKVTAACKDGKAERIVLTNVPSFAVERDVSLEVAGIGTLMVDTAYGGDSFVLTDATALGLKIEPDKARDLVRIGRRITQAANEQIGFVHPTNPDWAHISFCQFAGPLGWDPHRKAHTMRNTVVVDPGKLDRSPTGTGLSARMALLWAQGRMQVRERLIMSSVIGSTFEGTIVGATQVGETPAIIPTISGRAWITGTAELTLDPTDPWPAGYRVADTWPTME